MAVFAWYCRGSWYSGVEELREPQVTRAMISVTCLAFIGETS